MDTRTGQDRALSRRETEDLHNVEQFRLAEAEEVPLTAGYLCEIVGTENICSTKLFSLFNELAPHALPRR